MRSLSGREMLRHYDISRLRLPQTCPPLPQKELHKHIIKSICFPGIRELVLRLKAEGFRLGILTSNSGANVRKFLEPGTWTPSTSSTRRRACSAKAGPPPPSAAAPGCAATKSSTSATRQGDIEACRRVPVPVISVSWGFHRRDLLSALLPDYLVDSPAEILAIVLG